MAETSKKQTRPRGADQRTTPRVSEVREQRDIAIYESHLRGNSIRAIQEEFQIKSTKTVWTALNRGKDLVIERGIDVEERRIEIDQLFANTLGMLAGEIARQTDEGRITTIERSDGSREIRRTKGVDPRTAEALARSADRWAQFLGITDRANEVTNQAVTMVQLSAPADGASFGSKWGSNGESGHESGHEMPSAHADPAPALAAPTDGGAVIDLVGR